MFLWIGALGLMFPFICIIFAGWIIERFWGFFVWILYSLAALFVLGFLIMCFNELKRYLKRRKAEKQNSENQNLIIGTE